MKSSNENIKKSNENTQEISVKVNNKTFQNTDMDDTANAMIIADSGKEKFDTHSTWESAKNEDLFTHVTGKFNITFPSGTVQEKDLKKLSYTLKIDPGSGLETVNVAPFQAWRWIGVGGGNYAEVTDDSSGGGTLFKGSINDMGNAEIANPGHGYYFEQSPEDIEITEETETITTRDYGGYVVGYENVVVDLVWWASYGDYRWSFVSADYRYGSVSGQRKITTYFRNITACSYEFIEGYGYQIIQDQKPGQQVASYKDPADSYGSQGSGLPNTYEAQFSFFSGYFPYSIAVVTEGSNYTYEAEWGDFHWSDPNPDPENERILSGPIPFFDEALTMPILFNGNGSIQPPVAFDPGLGSFSADTDPNGAGKSAQDHYDDIVTDMPTFDNPITIKQGNNEIERKKMINYLVKSQHSSCFIKKTGKDEYNMVIDFEIFFSSRNGRRIIIERESTTTTYTGSEAFTSPLILANADRFIASDNHAYVQAEILYHDTKDLKSLEPYA